MEKHYILVILLVIAFFICGIRCDGGDEEDMDCGYLGEATSNANSLRTEDCIFFFTDGVIEEIEIRNDCQIQLSEDAFLFYECVFPTESTYYDKRYYFDFYDRKTGTILGADWIYWDRIEQPRHKQIGITISKHSAIYEKHHGIYHFGKGETMSEALTEEKQDVNDLIQIKVSAEVSTVLLKKYEVFYEGEYKQYDGIIPEDAIAKFFSIPESEIPYTISLNPSFPSGMSPTGSKIHAWYQATVKDVLNFVLVRPF